MVFKKNKPAEKIVVDFLTGLILVWRNLFLLIFYPYKIVRKISLEGDWYQVCLIFLGVFGYFKFVYFLRDKPYPASLTFLFFLINFFLTVSFFWLFAWLIDNKKTKKDYLSLIHTFSYSLLPTLIWFLTVSIFYLILPPPRTTSIFGISFSVFFLAFSFSLLIWKLILVFLSLRFSLRLGFYRIFYFLIFYLLWFLPYSVFLYHFRIFRVPFI
ncbi:MAG: hypothetical protein N2482_01125 [Patescibacteria group bacterium]|nr:hypothetical protein [Patescibacteria group bacterium]